MQEHAWDEVRQDCHQLLRQALQRIEALTGLPPAYPESQELAPHPLPPQMGIARLPRLRDLAAVKARLYDEYRIEVPLVEWNGEHFMRISIQGYNTRSDVDALVQALAQILPSQTG